MLNFSKLGTPAGERARRDYFRTMPRPIVVSAFASILALGTHSTPALAHIDLQSPIPRASGFPDTYLRRQPCGQVRNGRVPEKVSVFRPGESIDVVWDVYVQHVSYFRVSFDSAGDDSFSERSVRPPDPATDDLEALPASEGETILAYVPDPRGDVDHVEQRVTLPREECDDCTLQLIQFTYGLPLDEATYYQCADIRLEGTPVEETPVVDDGTPRADAGASEAGSSAPVASAADESSGCALGHPVSTRSGWLGRLGASGTLGTSGALAGLLALGWRRRRRP